MAMAMTIVERLELLWYQDNVIWPKPICGRDQNDQPESESEPELEPEKTDASCTSSNDGGDEQSSGSSMEESEQQGGGGQQNHGLGLFERRHRRSVSDDMRLDMSKVLAPRREGPSSLDSTVKAALQPSLIKEPQPIKNIKVPMLATIASGKEFKEPSQIKIAPKIQQTTPRHRVRKRATKSLSDLEFDEVKGFSELGFTFSEDELTPRVVQVLPGLQRLGKQVTTYESNQNVSRPYPPETWLMRRPDPSLRKLQMPAPHMQGVDMKEHLKFWAQAVASTVKMEC